ncbi:MAG: DUF4382 domain-containing protein [Nitrososphaerota archaeon]|nr:DUF4382 domain-containing protein [Nitrososphaerota archaeon]MDG6939490.1 DUF4382 domain-containing protein [Nitrososphaerota archaeon]
MAGKAVAAILAVVVVAGAGLGSYFYLLTGAVNVYVSTGNADPIYLTISSIMLHSKSGAWVTVSNKTVTVELGGNLSFLGSARLPAGNYTEVRLDVTAATASILGVNVTVSVPSGVFKIPVVPSGLVVKGGQTAKLEVLIGPNLLQTGNGRYVLSPVVTAEQIP